ncbi:PAS sensor protein [Candidatus Calescamantes bacterium]|nr:PAS sensor protein [Candidatus Calescamantes bacterium]MCK5599533.1 PAS sensor protein [bacterium]
MDWTRELDASITVCDAEGNIVYMNDKAKATFKKWGGDLVGSNLKDCHNPNSWEIIKKLIAHDEKNIYTMEKEGIKKLIYQAPWYNDKKVAGLVELSLEIPFEMQHRVRD